MKLRLLTAALFSLSTLALQAAPPAPVQIGMVLSNSHFTIQNIPSRAGATLFEGDRIASAAASTRVHLANGAEVEVFAHSTAAIFASHAEVSAGTVSVLTSSGYPVQAAGYSARPGAPNTRVIVQLAGNAATVSVPLGSAEVYNVAGVLLSKMPTGAALSFAAAAAPISLQQVRILGVLTRANQRFFIRDRYTNLVSELIGDVPSKNLDKLVTIDGEVTSTSSVVPGVDRTVQVDRILPSDASVGAPCLVDGAGGVARMVELNGLLQKSQGNYFVTNADGKSYEVTGDVDRLREGQKVHTAAFLLDSRREPATAQQVVFTEHRKFIFFNSPCAGLITAGSLITTGILLTPKNDSLSAAATVTPISF